MLSSDTLRTFRLQKGMSLQTVAEKAGTTKSQLDKLEKGERRLTVEWLLRIAHALEVEPAALLDVGNSAVATPTVFEGGMLRDAPADPYDAGISSHRIMPDASLPVQGIIDPLSGELHSMREIVSYVQRPAALHSVRQAFAVYCPDDTLLPRYATGDLLYVTTARPTTVGCFVCLVLKTDIAMLGRFVARDAQRMTLQTFQPEKIISIELADVRLIGRIVGSMEGN